MFQFVGITAAPEDTYYSEARADNFLPLSRSLQDALNNQIGKSKEQQEKQIGKYT